MPEASAPWRAGRTAADSAGREIVNAGRCFALAVLVVVLFSVGRAFRLLGPAPISVSAFTAALVLIAWSSRATLTDLGLGRKDVPSGLLYGAGVFGLVLLVLVVAAVIPATNGFLHDSRAQIGGGRLLYELGVSLVLLTAIPEEFAFRGVLLGSGLKLWGPWRASLITSVLFGLWHIAPTLHTMTDNRIFRGASGSVGGQVLVVLGAIAVTFVAGLAFCWLRLRSKSLIASVIAHAATDGLALAVAWFAVHHPRLFG
jgi:CAAX protease family protein